MESREENGGANGHVVDSSGSSSSGSLNDPGSWFTRAVAIAIDVDFLWLAVAGLFTLVAGLVTRVVPPRTIPFYLDDARLWGTYQSSGTVPFWQVGVVTVLIFPAATAAMEYSSSRSVRRSLRFAIALLAAIGMTSGATETIKSTCGFLRPDFGQRCLGTNTVFPVGELEGDGRPRTILSNDECPALQTGSSTKRLRDGRRSFPSGHTSVVVAGSSFMTGYALFWGAQHPARKALVALNRSSSGRAGRARPGSVIGRALFTQILETLVVLAAVGYAGYVSVSRLVDFRHHPADVAAGATLGSLFGVLFLVRTVTSTLTEQANMDLDGELGGWSRGKNSRA